MLPKLSLLNLPCLDFQRTLWHYQNFCTEAGAPCYPGDPKLVGACLSLRASNSQSVSMVDKLYCAIAHEHKKQFLPSPTEHPTIRLLMRSIRRHLSRPRQPVAPLGPDHLLKINTHLHQLGPSASLETWRTIWRANIQYYSACRFSEINGLTHSELKIHTQPLPHLTLHIKKSKTDQNGEGFIKHVYPVTSQPLLCPLRLTKLYLARLKCHLPPGKNYEGFLQPRIRFDKQKQIQIPLPSYNIGYSSCLDETRQLMQHLNIEGRFGEHSGRRGAATQIALNGGSVLDIQNAGNWKSSSNAQKYVDSSCRQKSDLARLLLPKP